MKRAIGSGHALEQRGHSLGDGLLYAICRNVVRKNNMQDMHAGWGITSSLHILPA